MKNMVLSMVEPRDTPPIRAVAILMRTCRSPMIPKVMANGRELMTTPMRPKRTELKMTGSRKRKTTPRT